jgi:hypothetical protein
VFRKVISVRLSKLKVLLLLTIPTAIFLVLPYWSAESNSLKKQAHRYYIQGYQQGKADAMASENFQPDLNVTKQKAFSREYVRGYGDGYKLVNR